MVSFVLLYEVVSVAGPGVALGPVRTAPTESPPPLIRHREPQRRHRRTQRNHHSRPCHRQSLNAVTLGVGVNGDAADRIAAAGTHHGSCVEPAKTIASQMKPCPGSGARLRRPGGSLLFVVRGVFDHISNVLKKRGVFFDSRCASPESVVRKIAP